MSKGNEILLEGNPKGKFFEGIIVGTPKPGTVMELVAGTASVNGRFSYEPAGTTANSGAVTGMAADGNRLPIAVLLPDRLQGGLSSTAYTTGTIGFMYFPVMGEELNMILKDESGTAADQDFTIGTKLIVDDGTGKLVVSASTPEAEPFISLEVKADLAADYLCWCMFTGY